MKPWCVIRVNFNAATNLRFNGAPKRGVETGVAWMEEQHLANPYQEGFDNVKQHVFHVDTEEDAKWLANYMASRHPEFHYVTAKCSDVFKAAPGPVARSQFTKDGLIPL